MPALKVDDLAKTFPLKKPLFRPGAAGGAGGAAHEF